MLRCGKDERESRNTGLRGSFSTSVGGKNPFSTPPQAEKALKRAMEVAAKHAKHLRTKVCLSDKPAPF